MDDHTPGEAGAAGEAPAVPASAGSGTGGLRDALDTGWVVLARPDPADSPGRARSPRRAVLLVTLAAVVVAAVVAVGGLLVSQRIAEGQAVHDVAELTDDLAVSVVQPALTDPMAANPEQARAVLDPRVRHWLGGVGEMVRVKVWTTRGTVLYSDEPRLIGRTFPLDDDSRAALLRPRTEADITDLSRPENRYERGEGKLLEVYRPVWTPNGTPLLFETYFRYDTVSQRSQQLWRGFAGVMLSSLLALLLLLGAGGWLLAVRARRTGARNEELLRRALDASDAERHRIAATLHDGVVQQLVAASFIAAGQALRVAAGSGGDPQLAADLDTVASAVRDGIAGLRSLLVDIYPPSLHTAGLASALRDFADAASRGAGELPDIDAEVDVDVADRVPEREREAMFRIAQEAVHNALRHAHASHLTLRLAADKNIPALEIADDGAGFDPRSAADGIDGHFGLRLMAEAARHGGGWLGLLSAPGAGTLVRYEAADG